MYKFPDVSEDPEKEIDVVPTRKPLLEYRYTVVESDREEPPVSYLETVAVKETPADGCIFYTVVEDKEILK
jgi:hypothetical protein